VNRRQYIRHPISISALLHPGKGRSWLCTIRDFCEMGVLLVGTGGSRSLQATGSKSRPGDRIDLHFSVPTEFGEKHFRLGAIVARFTNQNMSVGVRFESPLEPEIFSALMDFAVASGVVASDPDLDEEAIAGTVPESLLRDQRIPDEEAKKIRSELETRTSEIVHTISTLFFEICARELLVKARDAGTNAGQMMYFEALDQLEARSEVISQRFRDEVIGQIRKVSDVKAVLEKRRRQQSGGGDVGSGSKLALVDTDEFEEWLAVAEVVSKSESRSKNTLIDIRLQLGLVVKPWGHQDIMPTGPVVLTWAFHDAIEDMDLRRNVRYELYKVFEEIVLKVLPDFYIALLAYLTDTGIFPSLEEVHVAVARSRMGKGASAHARPGVYEGMESSVREAAMAADGIPTNRAYNPFETNAGTADVYKTARELLSLGRSARTQQGHDSGLSFAPADAQPEQRYHTTDILQAMARVENELGDDTSLGDIRLKPRLLQILEGTHGGRKAIAEEQYDALGVMENLVDSIQADGFLTDGIRDWLKRMELTLNKVALSDPGFLASNVDEPHSAVQVLNTLARLGNAKDVGVGIDRNVGRKVDELLDRLVKEYDSNPEIFEEILHELNPLVAQQSKAYQGNVERTVKTSEGHQKLARARRAVVKELELRIAEQDVPNLLLELLNPGWRNLMVHTFLRAGPESNQWADTLSILDQVMAQLVGTSQSGDVDFTEPEGLLKRVVEGLNSISFEPAKRTPLIMALSSALIGDASGNKQKCETTFVSGDGVSEALGLADILADENPTTESEDEEIQQSWGQSLDRARRIHVGEWVAMSDTHGRPLILSFAFVGDNYTQFVLVNRKGVKVLGFNLKELTDQLHDGRITLLEDFDMPLMERASQRMLQNMHDDLMFQSSHDELTGLINRKEFERNLEASIMRAKLQNKQHVLLYLDLDQFKIVNNTSGHAAGDELLKQVGEVLTDLLSDIAVCVARLGGDEFGILIENVLTQGARQHAQDVMNAMRNLKFEWQERKYTISASMGLVFLDEITDSVDTVMRHVDEACYMAKEAGRNRIQEYEIGDARMMRRHGVMEWVTALDKAVDENRLILNCQRIAPLHNRDPGAAHYEILLTMRDELGDIVAPGDFILAAETYNRMIVVDRWVIENTFRWMAENRSKVDRFSGFSINVSGHSINDESFSEFIMENFSTYQIPTGKITFEVTETAAISNLENAIDFMNRMKIIGCKFSLDDFGTGLSSYSYLRNLPVDYLKIDGVFVKDMDKNPSDYAVVKSINEIGHYMGKLTIAEYVENDSILEKLTEIGIDYGQGYGIEKPLLLSDLNP